MQSVLTALLIIFTAHLNKNKKVNMIMSRSNVFKLIYSSEVSWTVDTQCFLNWLAPTDQWQSHDTITWEWVGNNRGVSQTCEQMPTGNRDACTNPNCWVVGKLLMLYKKIFCEFLSPKFSPNHKKFRQSDILFAFCEKCERQREPWLISCGKFE